MTKYFEEKKNPIVYKVFYLFLCFQIITLNFFSFSILKVHKNDFLIKKEK